MVKESSWTAESPTVQFKTLIRSPFKVCRKGCRSALLCFRNASPSASPGASVPCPHSSTADSAWGLCREKITEGVIGFWDYSTLAHPELRRLAETTLAEVHRIQREAAKKLRTEATEITTRRLDLLIGQIARALRIDANRLKSRERMQRVSTNRFIAMCCSGAAMVLRITTIDC